MVDLDLPVVGADRDAWGLKLNSALGALEDAANAYAITLTSLQQQISARPDPAAKKTAPHQVTGVIASTAFPIDVATTPQGTVRYPVKFAAPVTRFRVHVRNYSYGDAAGYAGTVNLTGLWWGEGRYNLNSELDGGFKATPTQINAAATLAGTAEWVSGWVTVNASHGTDYLLSLGWTTPGTGAPSKIVSNWTRRWVSTDATHASQTAPSLSGGNGNGGMFDVWLECEIPASTPTVAFVGDSITVGDMHEQSYPRRYALAHDVWPLVFGHYGGSLGDWGSGSTDRWTRYGAVQADAALLMCGVNDIFSDATLNDLKNRTNAVWSRMRQYLTQRVFVSTILPSNAATMTTARETIRTGHNDWLIRMRSGIWGSFDLARTVVSPSNSAQMTAAYTWDGTHLSELGSVQITTAIPHLTRG